MATATKLTEFQKRFCAEFVSGKNAGNQRQSYLAVYKTKNPVSADTISWRLLNTDKIKNEIQRLKEGAGLTDEFIFQRIREGLDSNYIASYKGRAKLTDIPDQATRHKYIDLAAKLRDMFPSQKIESRSINIDVQVEKLGPGELAQLLTQMAKQLNAKSKGKTNLLGSGQDTNGA